VDRGTEAEAPGEPWGRVVLREGEARSEVVRFYQALPGGGRVARDEAGGPAFVVPTTEIVFQPVLGA